MLDRYRSDPKAQVFLSRYVRLAHHLPGEMESGPALVSSITVAELAKLWDCSERSAGESLQRLKSWGLVDWAPKRGRGKRSLIAVLVHPVHIYFEHAEKALAQNALAQAGFWLGEIQRECPCIPGVAVLLQQIREQLGLVPLTPCCPPFQDVGSS